MRALFFHRPVNHGHPHQRGPCRGLGIQTGSQLNDDEGIFAATVLVRRPEHGLGRRALRSPWNSLRSQPEGVRERGRIRPGGDALSRPCPYPRERRFSA